MLLQTGAFVQRIAETVLAIKNSNGKFSLVCKKVLVTTSFQETFIAPGTLMFATKQ